jgi:tryptophan-rich sensory protein
MRKTNWKTWLFWIALAEGVGFLSGWFSREGTELFAQTAEQPPLSPPAILFPIVWTVLYGLMGIGAASRFGGRCGCAARFPHCPKKAIG